MKKLIPKLQTAWGPIRPTSYMEENEPVWKTQFRQQQQQEDEEYQKDMSTPYYKMHSKPTKKQWRAMRDRATQSTGTVTKAEEVSAPVRAVNNYVREFKYDMSQGNVPKGKYTLPLAGLAATGIGTFLAAPVTTAASLAGGYFGSKAVDSGMKFATDKSWAEYVNENGLPLTGWLKGLDKEAAEVTNPGAWVGGGLGARTPSLVARRARAAAYDNIAPLGYNDANIAGITVSK